MPPTTTPSGIFVTINERDRQQLLDLVGNDPKQYRRHLAAAVNRASKKLRTLISDRVRKKVHLRKATVDRRIIFRNINSGQQVGVDVIVQESSRISLKEFRARQTKRGVSYKVSKERPRGFIKSGFGPKIARLGHHVFARAGKDRFPIIKRFGISPWGVVVKGGIEQEAVAAARRFLDEQVSDRIRFLQLKQTGGTR